MQRMQASLVCRGRISLSNRFFRPGGKIMRRMNYCLPVFLIAVAWTTTPLHAQVAFVEVPYVTAPYAPVRYAPAPYAAVPYAPVPYAPGPPVQAGGKIYVVLNSDIKSGKTATGSVTAG